MTQIPHHILVVGAGIAGLSAAICLARRGATVTVLERADEIKETGAGLQIAPNAVAVIHAMGLLPVLKASSTVIEEVELSDGRSGRKVMSLPLSADRYGGRGYHAVHRADLIDLLRVAASSNGVTVRLNAEVASAMGGDKPFVTLKSGEKIGADVVIGADGVRSALRAALPAQKEPVFTGNVAWRMLVPLPNLSRRVSEVHMLPGRHVVTYPLLQKRLLNIVAVEETPEWSSEGWNQIGDPESLRSRFHDVGGWLGDVLGQVERTHYWGLFKRPVPDRWSSGRLGLIGDAVHPTLPFMAQGANMALEDAWILGECLAAHPDPAEGLQAFAAKRTPRVRRIVSSSSRNAWIYHMSGPLRTAAHKVMGVGNVVAPQMAVKRFDWLFGYDPTKG